MNTSENSFEERNFKNKVDAADEKFKKQLDSTGVKYKKIGPDPKDDFIEDFWLISIMLVIPDYIVWGRDGNIQWVEVKGTNKIKNSDYIKLEKMHKQSEMVNPYSKKKIQVGIAYIKNPTYNDKVKWIPFEEFHTIWNDPKYEWKIYKEEYELDGSPKYYKQLDL